MKEKILKLKEPIKKVAPRKYLPVLLFGLLLAIILRYQGVSLPQQTYVVGDIAREDIYAPQDLNIVDEESTENKRKESRNNVKSVYDYSFRENERILDRLHEAFDVARKSLATSPPNSRIQDGTRKKFEDTLAIQISKTEFRNLHSNRFSSRHENAIQKLLLSTTQNLNIISSKELLALDSSKGIIRREIKGSEVIKEETINDFAGIMDLEQVRNLIKKQFSKVFGNHFPYSRNTLIGLSQKLIRPTLTFNQAETENRRQEAYDSDQNIVPIIVRKNAIIVRAGNVIEPRHVKIIQGIVKDSRSVQDWVTLLGVFFLTLLLVQVFWLYGSNFRRIRLTSKDYYFIATAILSVFLLSRFFLFLFSGVVPPGSNIPNQSIYYFLPLAMAAMVVRLVIGSEMALFVAMLIAFLSGIYLENSIFYGSYFFISSVFGAISVASVRKRIDVVKAGIATGFLNMLTYLVISLFTSFSEQFSGSYTLMHFFWNILFAFCGGMVASFLLIIMLMIAESLFNYTTDFKLLELANQNSPLLRELMVQAPGTYHHSIIVGTLSESAANAIGENGLLGRVACLYHDIGKSKKPQYYVENQTQRINRHDKLTPRMSARVIQAHVKDGIEMAQAAKIPKEIIDMIPQHHGTRLISFFYNKAKEKVDPEVETIDEKDFRYEGPKPQTRVAGIILLADGLEAITRTLDDPTPSRIKGVVRDHINNIFSEGELDETELTLRDLSAIANAFTRVLTSIFHHRIDYPSVAGKETQTRLRKVHDNSDSKPTSKDAPRPPEGEEGDPGHSPRLKIT